MLQKARYLISGSSWRLAVITYCVAGDRTHASAEARLHRVRATRPQHDRALQDVALREILSLAEACLLLTSDFPRSCYDSWVWLSAVLRKRAGRVGDAARHPFGYRVQTSVITRGPSESVPNADPKLPKSYITEPAQCKEIRGRVI